MTVSKKQLEILDQWVNAEKPKSWLSKEPLAVRRALQAMLNEAGAQLEIDGRWGSKTPSKKALEDLKRRLGIADDRKLIGALIASHQRVETALAAAAREAEIDKKAALDAAAQTAEAEMRAALAAAAEEYRKGKPKAQPETARRGVSMAKPTARRQRGFYVDTRIQKTDFGVSARLLGVEPVGQKLEFWCWAACTEVMLSYLRSCPECGHAPASNADLEQGRQMNRKLPNQDVDCRKVVTGSDYKTCDRGGWPYFFEFEDRVQSTMWGSRRHVLEEHGMQFLPGGPRLRVQGRLSDDHLLNLCQNSHWQFRKRLNDAEGAALSWEMLTDLIDKDRPVAFSFRFQQRGSGHMRLAYGYAVTPGDRKWVAVCDPLPPGSGEVYLIPYEYYVNGPHDGHWRDYWVLPDDEEAGSRLPLRSEVLRVGRELVASYIEYPEDPRERDLPTDGEKLTKNDKRAAHLEAQAGFEAVKAIAMEAKPLAAQLGMGAAWERAGTKLVSDHTGLHSDYTTPESNSRFALRDVKPGDLVLDEADLIPVYELTAKELKDWDTRGGGEEEILELLDRPREIIYAVTRPDQKPLSFYAAITVRRKRDTWKLASLGRVCLMRFFMGEQLERALGRSLQGEESGGYNPVTAYLRTLLASSPRDLFFAESRKEAMQELGPEASEEDLQEWVDRRLVEELREEATAALGGNPSDRQIKDWALKKMETPLLDTLIYEGNREKAVKALGPEASNEDLEEWMDAQLTDEHREEATVALGGKPSDRQIKEWALRRLKEEAFNQPQEEFGEETVNPPTVKERAAMREQDLAVLEEELNELSGSYPQEAWKRRFESVDEQLKSLQATLDSARKKAVQQIDKAEVENPGLSEPERRALVSKVLEDLQATTVALYRARGEEGWERAAQWAWTWNLLRDETLRAVLQTALSEDTSQGLARYFQGLFPVYWYSNWSYDKKKTYLLGLIKRENVIDGLCEDWSTKQPAGEERRKRLGEIFEHTRDQEAEWLRWKGSPSAKKRLSELIVERGLDKGDPKPKYILSVPELYQLLAAYRPLDVGGGTTDPDLDDDVKAVYEKSFHRPEKRIESGTLLEVLTDLQDVAKGIEVRRRS